VELCALALRYYPAAVQDGYFNNSELLTQANEFTLDETLVDPKSRDMKLMFKCFFPFGNYVFDLFELGRMWVDKKINVFCV